MEGLFEMGMNYVWLFFVLPVLLTFYLIFILVKWIYRKKVSKNYAYIYWVFLGAVLLFYFTFFTQLSHSEFIPEDQFETKLYNIVVKDENNGLVHLWKFIESNIGFMDQIKEIEGSSRNFYQCITKNSECWDLDRDDIETKYFNFIGENIEQITDIHKQLVDIIDYEYFKHDIDKNEFIHFQWLSLLSRFWLMESIYFFEKGEIQKALDILKTYSLLWDKLMYGDTSLIWVLVWITVKNISLENYYYVLSKYYQWDDKEFFDVLHEDLDHMYDTQEIFENAIKMEYQISSSSLDTVLHSSMLFNKEEFFNIKRVGWQRMIEWKGDLYWDVQPNFWTREYLYYKLLGHNFYSFSSYHKNIEDLNILKNQSRELMK